ncbi:hypothetical protein Gpo141_00010068 [Globisporangium polare]
MSTSYTATSTSRNSDMTPTLAVAADASSTVEQAQQWSSTLLKYSVRLEHAAVDIQTDRILYHLDCELQDPIPPSLLRHFEFISLGYPLGGIWKVHKVGKGSRFLQCLAWRKTELNHEAVEAMNDELVARQQVVIPEPPLSIFDWKMHLGTYKDKSHWYLRTVLPPSGTSSSPAPPPANTPVHVKLLAGFAPIEVYLTVNSITSVDTVAQTFTADVTWEVTLSAVTAIWEDSVLRELLDLFEFNEDEFEFTNVTSMQEEKAITTVLAFAGVVDYQEPAVHHPHGVIKEPLSHLKYSRRSIAVFSEEMSLYNFPYDQQKLNFAFSMGSGVRPSLAITPASIESGKFAREDFKLGNVFNVVYDDKVFIGAVHDTPTKKAIEFEIMLERRSGYYFTNVAIPSAIITYLCFTTFAPDDTGAFMDTSSRLQIVITLLLTAVTFKNQVASLIPQVSYFTTLDKYVFVCFIITCLVTLENSLFPSLVNIFPTWKETGLLSFSVSAFSLTNLVWMAYLVFWIRLRAHRSKVLLQVEEYMRVVSAAIPASHREAVVREYLSEIGLKAWELPTITCTDTGFIFIELPEESPLEVQNKRAKDPEASREFRETAHHALPNIQRVYHKLDPSAPHTDIAESCIDLHEHVDVSASKGMAGVLARRMSSHDESDVVSLRQSVLHDLRAGQQQRYSDAATPPTAQGRRSSIGVQSGVI